MLLSGRRRPSHRTFLYFSTSLFLWHLFSVFLHLRVPLALAALLFVPVRFLMFLRTWLREAVTSVDLPASGAPRPLGALLVFLAGFFLRPVFGVKWWPLSLVPTLLLLAAFLCAAATPFLFPPPHPDLPWSVRAALALLTAATLAGLVLPFRLPKTRRTLAWMYVLVSAAGFAFVVHYNLYLFFR